MAETAGCRLTKSMTYPDALTPEQWAFVSRYSLMPRRLAKRWARRCQYPSRVDEFHDELLAALLFAARRFHPKVPGTYTGGYAYARRWLSAFQRRCHTRRTQWDRTRSLSGSPMIPPDTAAIDDRDEAEYALAALDEPTRSAIRAIFWEGASRREAAAILGCGYTKAGAILRAAMATMRARLEAA